MSAKLYYTAPSDEVFEEVKKAAMELWAEVGSHPSYVAEKQERISGIANVSDNLMYIVAMFDDKNQYLLSGKLSDVARSEIRARMEDGGTPSYLIHF